MKIVTMKKTLMVLTGATIGFVAGVAITVLLLGIMLSSDEPPKQTIRPDPEQAKQRDERMRQKLERTERK